MALRLPLLLLVMTAPALPAVAGPVASPPPGADKITWKQHIAPLLAKYCTQCHGGARPKGDLALDVDRGEAAGGADQDLWGQVVEKLHAQEMPPKGRPRPTKAELDLIVTWAGSRVARADCGGKKDPGQVTLRRLNRAEYDNTVRDLLGVRFQPADDFPADDVGYGFDNIGDVLSLPPLLMEKYLAAAEKVADLAFQTPEVRQRIMTCQPTDKTKAECARKIIGELARRAYRRPVSAGEVDRLAGFVTLAESQGDSFEKGIQVALTAILVSPHFLFRVERDPKVNQGDAHPVSDYELASRLSYFLWSSMPDEELFALAGRGALRKEGVLEAQVRRMLKDPRARALVENFAGQWLQTRNLKTVTPDPALFPGFDEALRRAMLRETELFFEAVVNEDRSVLDFLDARFTFLNERLARHYGIAGVQGDQFRRVTLTGDQRGGILTQAGILTVTSNPTRTSPVKRGKWILENILGAPPPPPPPGVADLSEAREAVLSGSLRQRMEQHRAKAECASCHQRMDPLGFGLENYDAVGAWRERDGNFPVDASGTLPGGQSFKGPAELKAILKTREDAFRRCLTEKMLTYALGRGLEDADRCTVEQICGTLAKNGNRFSSLVIAVVQCDPFQMRRRKRGDK